MGMLAELNAALAEAFDDPDGLADAVKSFTATRQGEAAYNPAAGEVESTATTYTGRGIFANYSARDIDGTLILSSDVKLTALQIEATDAPKVGDKINGKRVETVGQDPVSCTWALQLRA